MKYPLLIESLTFRSAGFARRFVQLPARSGHMPESLWATVVRLCMYSYRFIVYTYSCTWPLFDRRQARRSTVDAYAAWPSAHTGYARAPQRSRVVCSLPDHPRPQRTLLLWGPVSAAAAFPPAQNVLAAPAAALYFVLLSLAPACVLYRRATAPSPGVAASRNSAPVASLRCLRPGSPLGVTASCS